MTWGRKTGTAVRMACWNRSLPDRTGTTHFPAWREFNAKIGSNGDVGVYHETYSVAPGAYECIYANTPVMGLAAAGEHLAVGRGAERARERIAS